MNDEHRTEWHHFVPNGDPHHAVTSYGMASEEFGYLFSASSPDTLAMRIDLPAGPIVGLTGNRMRPITFSMREWRREPSLHHLGRVVTSNLQAFEVRLHGLLVPDDNGHFYTITTRPTTRK